MKFAISEYKKYNKHPSVCHNYRIEACAQDNDGFQMVKNDIGKQMEQFNQKYEKLEKEQKAKEIVKSRLDGATYILILFLIMFNALNAKAEK